MDDARTSNQAEADLHARIMAEIVEPEVMAPMERIGWSETGVEMVPAVPDNPAVVETPASRQPEPVKPDNPVTPPAGQPDPATTTAPEVDWESLREANGLILGKYKDSFSATRGVGHAVAMAKQAFTERDELARRIHELETRTTLPTAAPSPIAPVETTPQPSILDTVFKEIVDEGGLIDETTGPKLRQALREEAVRVAKETVAETRQIQDRETSEWTQVGAYMQVNHPESVNFTEELNLFVAANPALKNTVANLLKDGDKIGATEFAWVKYNAAREAQTAQTTHAANVTQEIKLTAAEQVRQEAVAAARRDAGVVTTSAGGVHETVPQTADQDEIELAAAEMRRTGLGDRWRQLVIGSQLKGPLFD